MQEEITVTRLTREGGRKLFVLETAGDRKGASMYFLLFLYTVSNYLGGRGEGGRKARKGNPKLTKRKQKTLTVRTAS